MKIKKLNWIKKQDNWCIYADCPQGYFCIEDGYSYQLFNKDGYPITDAEGADSLEEAKQLCQDWVEKMITEVMEFLEERPNEHCDIGTFEHSVMVECPEWLYEDKRPYVGIDRCIMDEIKYLWSKGIRTYGSCCGHGKLVPMVNVHDDDIDKMVEMGYIGGINKHGAATFTLKSLNGWEEK
jgi:hypothetical protein